MLTVQLHDVGLRYADSPLFENLNLTLQGGQWTCLLGQSGIGKSSLLRVIAGLLPGESISGSIQCDDNQTLTGRVAYMSQQDLLLPWLNVLQNVLLGHRLRSRITQQLENKARDLIAAVGLAGTEQQLPQTLSGGMRQRVALARTLMEDKPINLLDEPFSSLDALTRHRLQTLAAELLAERTNLLVTHDPLEALRLGHRVYILSGSSPTLRPPIEPAGEPPRPLGSADLLPLHEQLLSQLAAEH